MFGKNSFEHDLLLTRMTACHLFENLSGSEVKTLLNSAHIRDYAEGEKIFDEGTIGLCFYIVVKGSVKIVSQSEGKAETIRDFKEGDFFSEIHLFSEHFHSVSCIASEVTKLIVFAKPDFEDLVKIKSRLGNKVLLKFLEFFGTKLDELYKENRELKHRLYQLVQ